MKIALCAGHHPEAKGAVNKRYNLNEHDEAWKVVAHAVLLLKARGHAVVVPTGRLKQKIERINSEPFDLAIDLHFNADADHLDPDDLDDSRGHGCMVMYCPRAAKYGDPEPATPRQMQAHEMASAMATYIGNRNLGARPGWYWGSNPPTRKDAFLAQTDWPAFIPEFGYIDNNAFAEKWLVSGRHAQLAEALLFGISEAGWHI